MQRFPHLCQMFSVLPELKICESNVLFPLYSPAHCDNVKMCFRKRSRSNCLALLTLWKNMYDFFLPQCAFSSLIGKYMKLVRVGTLFYLFNARARGKF